MKKYILSLLLFTGLFFSCGYDSREAAQNYLDQYVSKKWRNFAEAIGFPKGDLRGRFKLAVNPSEEGIRQGIIDDLTKENPKTKFMSQELSKDGKTPTLQKMLTKKVFDHWKTGLSADELIADNFQQLKLIEPRHKLYKIYAISYRVNIKKNSQTEKRTNVAYLSVPTRNVKGHPVVYFHKDDKGLSTRLMEEEVGDKVLSERIVIAPAGSRQALINIYSAKRDPKAGNIISASTHAEGLPWADTVDDAISLLRGLITPSLNKIAAEGTPPGFTFPHNIQCSQNEEQKDLGDLLLTGNLDKSIPNLFPIFDFLGFSTGGLTAGLTAAKIGGYLNQNSLMEIQKLKQSEDKEIRKTANDQMGAYVATQKLVFIQKLVITSAPTSFIHGPFRAVLQSCVTGEIHDPSSPFNDYTKYPGLRHSLQLFDSYKSATEGSPEEETERELLSKQVLSRDLSFQIPYALGGAMNGSVLKALDLGKPQIAILHHMQDGMIQFTHGSLPLVAVLKQEGLQKFLEEKLETPFHFYSREISSFVDPAKDLKKDEDKALGYHLEAPFFWNKTKSVNEKGQSPREALNEILDPSNVIQ